MRGRGDGRDRRDGEGSRALRRLLDQDAAGWREALARRDAMPRFDADALAPDPAWLGGLTAREPAGFLPALDGAAAHLEPAKLPAVQGFGHVGQAVDLVGGPVTPGILGIRFDAERLGGVAPETLRLFRWDEGRSGYEKVPVSAVSIDHDVVWGAVNVPGRYVVIGLDADPLVLRTILTFREIDAAIRALPEAGQRDFIDRVCGLILCSPDFAGLGGGRFDEMVAEQVGEGLPAPPRGYRGLGGGGVCERCLGLGTPWTGLPEFQLVPGRRPAGEGFFELPGRRCASRWESLGPANMGGCMLDLCVDPVDPRVVYAASANGGLWRLDANAGFTSYAWRPLTDDLDNLSVVAVAVSPSAPGVVFMADGAERVRRSTNGGGAWSEFASGMGAIRRLVAHPSDPDRVYVATVSGLWLAARNQATPTQLHAGDVTDMALDPSDPGIVYAAIRNVGVRRRDGGGTWTTILSITQAAQLSVGAFTGVAIKLALGGRGTPATRRVAVKMGPRGLDAAGTPVAEAFSEVFVNGAGGSGAWTRCTTPPALGYRPAGDWVNVIAVDPADDGVLLVGGERLARSADAGRTWTTVMFYYSERVGPTDHEDQHALAFVPSRPGVCWVANDGGVYRSVDGGAHWQGVNQGLVTTQPYNFGVEDESVLMDVYHWGVLGSRAVSGRQFEQVEGGSFEFTPVRGDPQRAGVFYYLRGGVTRRQYPSTGTNDYAQYTPWPISWGLAFDPRPGSTLAFAGRWTAATPASDIWRTTAAGQPSPTWTEDTITGVTLTHPIISIAFAESAPDTAYAVTDDGQVVRTTAASTGGAWAYRGTRGGPVSSVGVNRFDPNRLYAVGTWSVARSLDGGQSWQPAMGSGASALPSVRLFSIVTSPRSAGDLFLGTDIGVFYSPDEGFHWYPIHDGLPNASAWEIAWSRDALYAAVHGRGLWRARPYA